MFHTNKIAWILVVISFPTFLFTMDVDLKSRRSMRLTDLKKMGDNQKHQVLDRSSLKSALDVTEIDLIYQAKDAIKKGDIAALKKILSMNVIDFTSRKNAYSSPSFALIMWSVTMHRPEMVELLLQSGADANASSIEHPEGNTILSQVIYQAGFPKRVTGIPEICSLLIKHGAKLTKLCFIAAWAAGKPEIYDVLKQVPGSEVFVAELHSEIHEELINAESIRF